MFTQTVDDAVVAAKHLFIHDQTETYAVRIPGDVVVLCTVDYEEAIVQMYEVLDEFGVVIG